MERADYYVYVYIDPRSLEEFYYGKGSGSRKVIHLDEAGDNRKVKLIEANQGRRALTHNQGSCRWRY